MKISTFIYHDAYLEGCDCKAEQYDPKNKPSMYGYNAFSGDEMEPFEGEYPGAVITFEADTLPELQVKLMRYGFNLTRIRGADDDHYDYWPSSFSGFEDLCRQFDELAGGSEMIEVANFVWDDHAYDNWHYNYVLKESPEYAANEFAQEIHPRPTVKEVR